MLCGHAAPLADLGICFPIVDNSSNVKVKSIPADHGALISACTDGVLCTWSRGSGHCRRRRKMPPWVGSPSMIRALPTNPRYVCIACSFMDAVHLFDQHSVDLVEGGEASLDRESQYRKPPKCTVVIVDSYSLTIVQTVFHGNLSIGPLKFMAVILSPENCEMQSALMVDPYGKLQSVPILKDPTLGGESGAGLHKSSSHLDTTIWEDGLSEGGPVVSIATHGQFFVLVYRTCCIFRLLASGTAIGKISFVDNHLCFEDGSTHLHIVGGMFLEGNDASSMPSDAPTRSFSTPIILCPPRTDRPWSDCFLSVGEDFCVALTSLETLRVERMFPGHPSYPAKVVWDGARGYIACLCRNYSGTSDAVDVLFIWDMKTGVRERVLRGTASHSMFDNFCKGINMIPFPAVY
ncbi:hypothetical protein CK203_086616 [Vitis vinifera]|uniref:Uncharacterized protein n=1 Tax=Vitis vinifera TaxID=29760 RepID=A0A438E5U5_VITVI|nr:hypothetical protein CK203_086616 [Vitis vinifera]